MALSIKTRSYLQTVLAYMASWLFAMMLWTLLREYGAPPPEMASNLTIPDRIVITSIFVGIAGVLFGTVDTLLDNYLIKRIPLRRLLLLVLVLHTIVITIIFFVIYQYFLKFLALEGVSFKAFIDNPTVHVLYVYSILVNFVVATVRQINLLLGPGNLAKLLTGKFYKPRIEERIFMFLDLKSSTAIAEDIGHIRYSALLQDCFYDLAVVEEFGAQVYQYVGDEAVLSWHGTTDENIIKSVKAYWRFSRALEERRDYYLAEYGVEPQFKAGINSGLVTTAEVGEIKREIAHHGDTINTAARIQSKCNDFGQKLLISGALFTILKDLPGFRISKMGQEMLKGKKEPIEIFAVEQVPA